MRELRSRLALSPDQMPEPPLYQGKTPIFAVVARLVGVMVLAAGGALGFLWITAPHAAAPDGQVASPSGADVALVSYRSVEAAQPAPRRPLDTPTNSGPWTVANYGRGATDGVGTAPAVQAPSIAVQTAPRVPAAPRAVSPPVVVAPPAASPPVPAFPAPPPIAPAATSRAAPAPSVMAPVAAPAAPPANLASPDRDEVAALLARARSYLSAGDVAAARLVLRRAAERDDPQAALALGGTYDPTVLKRLGIINFHADPAQAREWYRRAAELGSADASLRLDQLVQTDR